MIVLGHGLWQRRFGADPAIAGKPITLSGRPFTVVGVAPPGFRGLDLILDCRFWVPLGNLDQLLPNPSQLPIARLPLDRGCGTPAPGVTRPQAAAELTVIAATLAKLIRNQRRTAASGSSRPDRCRRATGPRPAFLAALTVVVLLVLAIACANVANLLLAQASGRQREMAVRLALGATRGHLMRQMLAESLLLALGGGLLGVVLSLWATAALSAFRFPGAGAARPERRRRLAGPAVHVCAQRRHRAAVRAGPGLGRLRVPSWRAR